MAELQPRYEYRVWGNTLEDQKNELQRLGQMLRTESSEETYLISARTETRNVKIRRAQLSIKALLATTQELQLWKPTLAADFPLNRSVIAGQIFPEFELQAPELSRPRYSVDDFLREIIRPFSEIAVVKIFKTRTRFQFNECL